MNDRAAHAAMNKNGWKRRLFVMLRASIAVYVLLCVIGHFAYPRILFPAPIEQSPPIEPPIDPNAKLLRLTRAHGGPTAVLRYEPLLGEKDDARAVVGSDATWIVMFHGNGETMWSETGRARALQRRGFGVMLVEYRGYGVTYGSPPTEESLYEDGEIAVQSLATTTTTAAPNRIVLWGWSLGSGVAAEMARRGHGSRLILLSPFTSITDMARRVAPFLPVSLLMSHRLDTLSKAPDIKIPALVVHGDRDEVIPFEMGERVAHTLPNAQFIRVKGGHHADIFYEENAITPSASEIFETLVTFASFASPN